MDIFVVLNLVGLWEYRLADSLANFWVADWAEGTERKWVATMEQTLAVL